MGSAASKAPKRTFRKTGTLQRTENPTTQAADHVHPGTGAQPDPHQQSGEDAQPLGIYISTIQRKVHRSRSGIGAGQQEQEEIKEQDFLRELKQQGVKHAELGSFLDKLGGAIAGKHVSTLDIKVFPQLGSYRATLPNIQYSPLSTVIVAIQKLDARYCSNITWVTSRAPCPAAW